MPTYAASEKGYRALYNKATITPSKAAEIKRTVDKILANLPVYEDISKETGVPAKWIGPVHNRESSLNFKTHLHCGDPLTARTVHVPKGRPLSAPKSGHLPYTFQESAVDALVLKGLQNIRTWPLERWCYEWERYNGWGYIGKGNTPYLYAGTSVYIGGKYIADHVYSATAYDTQLGCVALLKEMEARDPVLAALLAVPESEMPADVKAAIDKDPKFKEITTTEDKTKKAAAAPVVAGGAGEGAKSTGTVAPDNPIVSPFITYTLIGAGVAMFLLAVFFIAKKKSAIVARWG